MATLDKMAVAVRSPCRLLLGNILHFLPCDVDLHCFIEGECIIEAKRLILAAVKGKLANKTDVAVLCMQTSSMTVALHEINIKLVSVFHEPALEEAKCSLKSTNKSLLYCCKNVRIFRDRIGEQRSLPRVVGHVYIIHACSYVQK